MALSRCIVPYRVDWLRGLNVDAVSHEHFSVNSHYDGTLKTRTVWEQVRKQILRQDPNIFFQALIEEQMRRDGQSVLSSPSSTLSSGKAFCMRLHRGQQSSLMLSEKQVNSCLNMLE